MLAPAWDLEYTPIKESKTWSAVQMFGFIKETFHRRIEKQTLTQTRYLYPLFNLNDRLTGLVGPRGVGKTTLLLQYIKNESIKNCFHFSAEVVYFYQTTLLEFVYALHVVEGYKIIFIDDIHKYQNWNQELHDIYASFPSLKIVFSGNFMLGHFENSHALPRLTKLYRLHGMSFRECLNITLGLNLQPIPFQDIVTNTKDALNQLKEVDRILPHFEEYLQKGYYPFVFEDPHSYYEKISRIIDKTISEDIANFYNLKTPNLLYFKKLLTYLASIPPGELNINNLAKHLEIDHKTVEHYITILASVGLAREMRPYGGGGSGMRKPSKLLLNNTNLIHTMSQYLGQQPSNGMERELFFVQSLQNTGIEVFYSKQADYRTRDTIFEIGGKNKTRDQLKEIKEPSYVVKDGILHPLKGEIPLFLFGFLY